VLLFNKQITCTIQCFPLKNSRRAKNRSCQDI